MSRWCCYERMSSDASHSCDSMKDQDTERMSFALIWISIMQKESILNKSTNALQNNKISILDLAWVTWVFNLQAQFHSLCVPKVLHKRTFMCPACALYSLCSVKNILQIILLCGCLGFCGFLVLTDLSVKENNARIFKNSSLNTWELDGTFPLLYVIEFNGQLWWSGVQAPFLLLK